MPAPFCESAHIPYVFEFLLDFIKRYEDFVLKKNDKLKEKITFFFQDRRYIDFSRYSAAGTLRFCHLWLFYLTKSDKKQQKATKATVCLA